MSDNVADLWTFLKCNEYSCNCVEVFTNDALKVLSTLKSFIYTSYAREVARDSNKKRIVL